MIKNRTQCMMDSALKLLLVGVGFKEALEINKRVNSVQICIRI